MEKIKIVIADDHKLVREGFVQLLTQNEKFELLAAAQDGEELLAFLKIHQPDIIILDISMPKLNGVGAITFIQEHYPQIKVIVLTMHEEVEYAFQCIKKGAKGYLLKNAEPSELYEAIYKVAFGETYYTPVIAKALITKMANNREKEEQLLSDREKEVIRCVIKGMSAKMIADTLLISSRTVEAHKVNIMKKMGVNNTAELVAKALKENIVSNN